MKTHDSIVFLRGQKTILSPLEETDLPNCVRWLNDPDVAQYLANHHPITLVGEKKWYENKQSSKDSLILAIRTLSGKHIGNMGIDEIKRIDGVATTGAFIGEKEYWGKGYGSDAKMVLLDYAFNTLNLRKICSLVIAFNARSIAYSKRCGYRVEGVRKAHVFRNGAYHDLVQLAVFKEDWLPLWKAYQGKRKKK